MRGLEQCQTADHRRLVDRQLQGDAAAIRQPDDVRPFQSHGCEQGRAIGGVSRDRGWAHEGTAGRVPAPMIENHPMVVPHGRLVGQRHKLVRDQCGLDQDYRLT